MAVRNPGEATHAFIEPLQRAVSCITRDVLVTSGYDRRPQPHVLAFDRGHPARLQGERPLLFRMQIEFQHAEDSELRSFWLVRPVGYWYAIETQDEREIVAYHWHPNASGGVIFPHLHLGYAVEVRDKAVAQAHLPTGHVALEDVLRLAIWHFGVRPLRDDWREVLNSTQAAQKRM